MTEIAKTELEVAREKLEASAAETNKSRTGKGTRVKVGATRGRNPVPISFESFDEALPDTLPKTISEFMDLFKDKPEATEPVMLGFMIDGYNQASYTTASDPIAEYVDATWPDDIKKNFRDVVRNYSKGAGVSIEDAVTLIKPGIVASQAKK